MIGEVVIGINNIYTVRLLPPDDGMRQCRIGGKVLQGDERVHNPIAVGDRVFVDADPLSREVGWITGRGERSGTLIRYNKKRRAPQVLAANVDLLICVSSARHPPFRPRFLDRLLVGGETGGVEPVIFVNKCDLGVGRSAGERIDDYRRMGYGVLNGSAVSGEGIDRLHDLLRGRTSVMIGQSGVGKSSVLNRLEPSLRLRVGDLSAKFDRGAHTTNFAVMVTLIRFFLCKSLVFFTSPAFTILSMMPETE